MCAISATNLGGEVIQNLEVVSSDVGLIVGLTNSALNLGGVTHVSF